MAPEAGVKFLGVHDQHAVAARRVRIGAEIADVRDPLLLVDDEIVDDVEILGPRLPREVVGRVPIGAAVIHVDVQVGAAPRAERRRQVVRLQRRRRAFGPSPAASFTVCRQGR